MALHPSPFCTGCWSLNLNHLKRLCAHDFPVGLLIGIDDHEIDDHEVDDHEVDAVGIDLVHEITVGVLGDYAFLTKMV